jgi:ribosome-associated protein
VTDAPLVVTDRLAIPAAELSWRFDTSGGPGGQHANRAASRAELSFDIAASPSLPDDARDRILGRLGRRAPRGILTVSVDESRSQWRNRILARRRMARVLADALAPEPAARRRTGPSRAARRRRLAAKRARSDTKRLRRRPGVED